MQKLVELETNADEMRRVALHWGSEESNRRDDWLDGLRALAAFGREALNENRGLYVWIAL